MSHSSPWGSPFQIPVLGFLVCLAVLTGLQPSMDSDQYSLPNSSVGGEASLSALWGPHGFSGLCCGGVCCVSLDDKVRLLSGHKLTGPAAG